MKSEQENPYSEAGIKRLQNSDYKDIVVENRVLKQWPLLCNVCVCTKWTLGCCGYGVRRESSVIVSCLLDSEV